MEIVNSVIDFCKAHWVEVLAIIGALDIVLGIVVKWTKVTWDDSIYTAIHNWIAKLVVKK